jgi:hypothetical protein
MQPKCDKFAVAKWFRLFRAADTALLTVGLSRSYVNSMKSVWCHYALTFLMVLANIGVSGLVVVGIRSKKPNWLSEGKRACLVIIGSFLLLVAGMGGVGWAIQTFDGNTRAEKWDHVIPQVLAHLGGFMIFVDLIAAAFDKCNRKTP